MRKVVSSIGRPGQYSRMSFSSDQVTGVGVALVIMEDGHG